MTEVLLKVLLDSTIGLVLVLLLRRPARRLFGAGPAFTLWLLSGVLAFATLLPQRFASAAMLVLPGLTVTPQAPVVAVAHASPGVEVSLVLLALWVAGVAICLARLVWHYVRLSSRARCGSPTWLAAVREAVPGLDARCVRMHADGPAVLWALPRSLLLLPEDFARRFDTAAARELVLRHELTHARRGDAWWCLAMEIISALLWFHPLAWLARPRFRLDQELACDAASLRALPSRHAGYARALLDSVAVQPISALIPWLSEPQLKERIAMITRTQPGALPPPRRLSRYRSVVDRQHPRCRRTDAGAGRDRCHVVIKATRGGCHLEERSSAALSRRGDQEWRAGHGDAECASRCHW